MAKKKGILIGCAALVVVVAAFLVIYFTCLQPTVAGEKNVTVDVVLADGTTNTYQYKTTEEYLGRMLVAEGLVEENQSEYGLYIMTVNGVTANGDNQEWWCITKGGEEVMTGADQTPLADGDKYELTLKVGYDF